MLLKMLCLKKDGLHKHSPMPAWLASLNQGVVNRKSCFRNWLETVSETRTAVTGNGWRPVAATAGLVTGTASLTRALHSPLITHLRA